MEGDYMKEFQSVRRCYHCGAAIQSEDPSKEGYIEASVIEKHDDDSILLCDSCYKRHHYNRTPKENEFSKDFLTMLKDARASDALIVSIIDLTSFECSLNYEMLQSVKGLKYLLIANKRDLMPKEYTSEDLKKYIISVFGEYGAEIKEEDIFLTSLLSGCDISEIVEKIEKMRNGHDVYIVGDKSSGKSYFLNAFLKQFKNKSNRSIGVTRYFGTQLDVLRIPLDSASFIYDTPGSELSNSFYKFTTHDKSLCKYLLSDEPYISKKVSIVKNGSLFISSLCRIDYLGEDKKISLSLHFPPKIQTKIVSPKKNMDELFMKYHQKKALKPTLSFIESISDYDIFEATIEDASHQELAISGLGWLSFKSISPVKIRIYVPKGIGIYAGKAKGHKNNVNAKK